MINRILIRIKVLQIIYSCYQSENKDFTVAEKELLLSIHKSYDLYFYLLLLIVEITRQQELILDAHKNKYLPTEEELHPNTRLIDNRFAVQLAKNEALLKYASQQALSWTDDRTFVRKLLEQILASDLYKAYLENENDSYETDREFWRAIFKNVICGNDEMDEFLQDKSIYWNDDVSIIETFVLKTIKQFDEKADSKQKLLPMYKDMEDQRFAIKLFKNTLENKTVYRERIEKHVKNWESERIANMDLIIMQVAIAELVTFPGIPISVTLNEYIDIAKYYSTPKSSTFINGILDSIVGELKNEKLLLKNWLLLLHLSL